MLKGPRFAKASYAMFAVAVMMAALKLGGVLDAEPLFLKTVPADQVAKTSEPEVRRQVEEREAPDPHRPAEEPAPGPTSHPFTGGLARSSGQEIKTTVFYRPSSVDFDGPVCGDLGDSPRSSRAVFPLPEEYFNSYDDTWGAARPQGGHEGSDLMSPAGTPEFAITDGTLVRVKRSNENGWNRLGGYTAMLKADYDVGPIKEGDLFYYAHLEEKSMLPVGSQVRAGQKIGTAGDTGEGPEVTRDKFPSHLHLGWYDGSGERSTLESGAMNPYPLLLWLEQNGGAVSGGTNVSYCEAPQGTVPKPSIGESLWPMPDSPGKTPDLDTGDPQDPRPAAEEPRQYHTAKRERTARQGDVSEWENEKVGKKREAREANPKSLLEKGNRQPVGAPARNENGPEREGGRTSRPFGGENSQRKEPRYDAGPSQAAPSRRSHVSILADVIDKVKTPKNRDEPDSLDERKQKKSPNFIKSESHAESRPVPDSREAPVASEETRESEGRQPEEHKAPSEASSKSDPGEMIPKAHRDRYAARSGG